MRQRRKPRFMRQRRPYKDRLKISPWAEWRRRQRSHVQDAFEGVLHFYPMEVSCAKTTTFAN